MSKKISVGIIGYGMAGSVFHAPVIHADQNFHLKKIVERHSELSRKRYPHVEVVRDVSALLSDTEIDLVVVATPNATHFELAKQSLLAHKHVVVDKPFTVTVHQADKLIALAQREQRILSVFQNRRWDGDFLTVKNIVEQQQLGRLVEFESHYDRYINYIRQNPWKENDDEGNGLLYDLGSHLIDQALVLFGMPESVYCDLAVRRDNGKIVDSFEVILHYNRMKAILRAGLLVREPGPRFALHGTNGSFIKFGLDPQEEMLKRGETPNSSEWGKDSPDLWGTLNTQIGELHIVGKIETVNGSYQSYYQNIYDAIAGNAELFVKPEQARTTIRIIELSMKSFKEKKVIPFTL